MTRRLARVAVLALVCAFMATPALARHHHKNNKHYSITTTSVIPSYEFCGDRYCSRKESSASMPTTSARTTHRHVLASRENALGSGVIRSSKTGATAVVAARYRAVFQAYIDDVEAAGGKITEMGGIRPGPCSIPRSKHPCGMALDLCQCARGRVAGACQGRLMKACILPREDDLASIAKRHDLVEGGIWCNGDRGHAEIRTERQAEACGHNLYAAVAKYRSAIFDKPHRRYRHIRYAHR